VTYAARLFLGTVAVLLVTVVLLVVGIDRSVRSDLEVELERTLAREVVLVRTALPVDSLAWHDAVRQMSAATRLRVTVVDQAGRVRADSDVLPDQLDRIENHATRPEIARALRGEIGADRRTSATIGARFLYVAAPGGPGVVRVAMSLAQVDDVVRRAQRPILLAGVLALALGTVLALIAGRRFARPLTEIGQSARAIARGEPPHFPHAGIPDVDRLTGDLREMHSQLNDRFEALRRRQAETTAIVDSMVEGVLSCDPKGRVVTANPAARRLLGYGDADSLPDLPLVFRAREAREVLDTALAGAAVEDRQIILGERTYLLNARPLPAGGAVIVLHDLTQQKRLETIRRDFVANVSHELKTPLTAISGYAETLITDGPDAETSKRFLETILANARRMQRLVDDQLDLSRIESGSWAPSPELVAVEPTIREAWTLVEPRQGVAPRLVVDVGVDADYVLADADAVRQVLRNLFENAIRHTPPQGTITARAVHEAGGIRLSVIDTGTGIASEHLPRVFERFYRVDAGRAREEGGTGLGLSIVRHLVEVHGGRVWAESELGRGTAVHSWFPSTGNGQ